MHMLAHNPSHRFYYSSSSRSWRLNMCVCVCAWSQVGSALGKNIWKLHSLYNQGNRTPSSLPIVLHKAILLGPKETEMAANNSLDIKTADGSPNAETESKPRWEKSICSTLGKGNPLALLENGQSWSWNWWMHFVANSYQCKLGRCHVLKRGLDKFRCGKVKSMAITHAVWMAPLRSEAIQMLILQN